MPKLNNTLLFTQSLVGSCQKRLIFAVLFQNMSSTSTASSAVLFNSITCSFQADELKCHCSTSTCLNLVDIYFTVVLDTFCRPVIHPCKNRHSSINISCHSSGLKMAQDASNSPKPHTKTHISMSQEASPNS